ncbi:MAG: hypothetical protein J5614_09610, partial [Paludibacteraceae bacterium]|nr:hypothetical protein [Paludibacteraceae bacterium]
TNELLTGFAKELTIDTNSVNRLWQKIGMHCISSGVSVDMERSDLTKGILKVVNYSDLQPIQGLELRITQDDSGAHCRAWLDGRELTGRTIKIEI